MKLKIKKHAVIQWYTQVSNITTNLKGKYILPYMLRYKENLYSSTAVLV